MGVLVGELSGEAATPHGQRCGHGMARTVFSALPLPNLLHTPSTQTPNGEGVAVYHLMLRAGVACIGCVLGV